jgi:hypothetical protein
MALAGVSSSAAMFPLPPVEYEIMQVSLSLVFVSDFDLN